jgi:hypothetical protein
MLIAQTLLAQEKSIPGVTLLEPSTVPVAEPGAGLFDQLVGVFTNSTEDTEIPAALNKLWKISMEGSMYKTMCLLGALIAVFVVGFWCVKFYDALQEGGLKPAGRDLAIATMLVFMLFNNGKNSAIPNSKKSGGVGGLLRCKAINHEVNQ